MGQYTLYYWPIPFRGEFIRTVLTFAGQSYEEPGMDEVAALKLLEPHAQPSPFMAPPVLVDHSANLSLAQMPAILRYLGAKHGLFPKHLSDAALTDKILGDANDVLDELTLFGGRAMWTFGEWATFVEDRLPRWVAIFEQKLLRQKVTADAGYLFTEEEPGLADLVVAVLWGVMTEKLRGLETVLDDGPRIKGLTKRIFALPEISELRVQSDARFGDVYCGGQIEASIRDMLIRNDVGTNK